MNQNTSLTLDSFRRSLGDPEPPAGLSAPLLALWWDARNDWNRAHACAQDDDAPEGAWVHAYLHRKEGDLPNAAYWYRRAGRPLAEGDLQAEWAAIASELLSDA
jgi:hypothetical protein